jgi:WD40 repeat protein
LTFNILFKKPSYSAETDKNKSITDNHQDEVNASEPVKAKDKKQQNPKPITKSKDVTFKHRLLSSCLKAHSDKVNSIDFSSNGKYMLSCGNDRTCFLWSTKEFEATQQHKNIRCNVEFDHAIQVKFSPDSKSFIAGLGLSNTIRAYKISKKDDQSSIQITQAAIQDFTQKHKADLINIGFSCNAKFLMSCSKDTHINIWNLKGDVLGSVDTRLMTNSFAAVSLCGRFFGACGFTSDVKFWEVLFDKSGEFKEIKRAFELKGHSAGVYNFSFNSDSTRIASVSKDKTWKLWDTNIDYERGQEARILLTGDLRLAEPYYLALSPDSLTIAVSSSRELSFFDANTGLQEEVIENVCNESLSEICFSTDNNFLAVASDRQIKIFYNYTGHKASINDLNEKLKTSKTEASKERILEMIKSHKKKIQQIDQRNNET